MFSKKQKMSNTSLSMSLHRRRRSKKECILQGDTKETLNALIPLLQRKEDRSWHDKIATEVQEWYDLLEKRAMQPADPVNPQFVFHELNKRLPTDIILSADFGSTTWYARNLKIRKGMKAS